MNIEEAILRDGRRLLDAFPSAATYAEDGSEARFVSIPKGTRGYVLTESGDDEYHYVWVHVFLPTNGLCELVTAFSVKTQSKE